MKTYIHTRAAWGGKLLICTAAFNWPREIERGRYTLLFRSRVCAKCSRRFESSYANVDWRMSRARAWIHYSVYITWRAGLGHYQLPPPADCSRVSTELYTEEPTPGLDKLDARTCADDDVPFFFYLFSYISSSIYTASRLYTFECNYSEREKERMARLLLLLLSELRFH